MTIFLPMLLLSIRLYEKLYNCNVLCEIEMAKATDRLEWPLMEAGVEKLGFHDNLHTVGRCISKAGI